MHVLGMPPAFVLSQDQTLKFIPDLLPLETNHPTNPSELDPNKGLQTFASMHEHQATPSITLVRPPSAHPFPLLHNLNQQSRGQTQTGPATEGPRLYAHPTPLVNSRFAPNIDRTVEAGLSFDATGARRIIDRVVTREPDPRKGVAST